MSARLQSVEETRARIAEATYELHATVGPARTTISAIAERAGVQRHTVYAHYPDLTALFRACTAHSIRVNNPPDPEAWRATEDPLERVRMGLAGIYDYYRRNTLLVGNVTRDLPLLPPEAREGAGAMLDRREAWFETMLEAWPADRRGTALAARIRHAMAFETWQSLTRNGLGDDEARDAMASFVALAAGQAPVAAGQAPVAAGAARVARDEPGPPIASVAAPDRD